MRATAAAAVLAALAVGVIAAGDSRAWSGADAGGRAATAVHMEAAGTWVPEVGYWAERWDPDGRLHPLVNTERRGQHWVQATSVPFALANRPLYGQLGTGGLLVLPVLGCVLAAVAARSLASWAGSVSPWAAFWAVGLGSPALFYAADAWEHAPALGLVLAALALTVARHGPWSAAVGGIAGGAAVVLRAEIAIYLVAAVAAAIVVTGQRRRWLGEWRRAVMVAVGAAVPVAVNGAAERALLGGGLRAQRASALAEGAGGSLGARASDAALTTVGIVAESSGEAFALGAIAAAALVVLGTTAVGRRRPRALLAHGVMVVGVGVAVAVRVDDGLGFVPGWLPAAPLAGAGLAALVAARRGGDDDGGARGFLGVAALLALPGVWLSAHVGLLEAQWGGRYVLTTGVLLTVVGVVALQRASPPRRPAAASLVVLTVAVSLAGVAWHVDRTRQIGDTGEWIMATADPAAAVISRWPDLGRETGAWYGQRRWLTARTSAEQAAALQVAERAGLALVVVVLPPGVPLGATTGWNRAGQAHHTVFGTPITAVTLRRAL